VCADEATANVDPETDELLRASLRQRFSGRSVLAVAHRAAAAADADRVLVVAKGAIAEEGNPQDLLADGKSAFAALLGGEE